MVNYTYLKTKTGDTVPAINGLPLHSTIDPVREAQKLLTTIPEDTGFIIFLGLGGGFAPLAALENTDAKITVIDFNKSSIDELLKSKDYSRLLNNERFTLLIDPLNEDIQNLIKTKYIPALYGNIKVLPLRTRVDADKELFESCASSIQQAISAVSSDYSVQAHFGRQWFSNIIRNTAQIQKATPFPANIKNVSCAAAGPSLDLQINELAKNKERGDFIISSDTSLGTLLQNGIKPDMIVSIDCQYKSYYHFLGKQISDIPIVLDIASPPMLSDITSKPHFIASGHPLARYISANWISLPELDTSGGNVTYACFSLAHSLGAQNITIYGADFAYIGSQTYARGTYVMPYFEERQNRFKTLEAQSSAFLYRSVFLEKEMPKQVYRETVQLKFYRECLQMKTGVKIKPGSGFPILIPQSLQRHETHREKTNSGKSSTEFLKDYRDKINNFNDNDVITTLLPYAAFLKHRNPKLKKQELLEETKKECIALIDKFL